MPIKSELDEHQGSFKEEMRGESLLATAALGQYGRRCVTLLACVPLAVGLTCVDGHRPQDSRATRAREHCSSTLSSAGETSPSLLEPSHRFLLI